MISSLRLDARGRLNHRPAGVGPEALETSAARARSSSNTLASNLATVSF